MAVCVSETASDTSRRDSSRTVEMVDYYTRVGRGIPFDRIIARVDMVSSFNFDR